MTTFTRFRREPGFDTNYRVNLFHFICVYQQDSEAGPKKVIIIKKNGYFYLTIPTDLPQPHKRVLREHYTCSFATKKTRGQSEFSS